MLKYLFFFFALFFIGCSSYFPVYIIQDKYNPASNIYTSNDIILQRENPLDDANVYLRFIGCGLDTVNTYMLIIYSGIKDAGLEKVKMKINKEVLTPEIIDRKQDRFAEKNMQEHLIIKLSEKLLEKMNKNLNVSLLLIGKNRNFDLDLTDLTVKKINRFHDAVKKKIKEIYF